MKRFAGLLASVIVVMILFWGRNRALAGAETNQNNACLSGALNTNTIWKSANNPYMVCSSGLTVQSGAKLTIQPGVVVQFQAGGTLYVQGGLDATGSITQTIIMTGLNSAKGYWGGVYVSSNTATPANANFQYVNLNGGGIHGTYGAEIYVEKGSITVSHSAIRNSAGNGVLVMFNGQAYIDTTDFAGNGQNAIQLNQPTTDLLNHGLTAENNGENAIRVVGGAIERGQKRWVNPGIPYLVDGAISNQFGDQLRIDQGSNLIFTPTGSVYIGGILTAIGSPSQPITFTGQTKLPGFWRGLVVYGGTTDAVAQLDYVTIEYAGNDIQGGNIEVGNGRVNIHHSKIRFSQKDGIKFDSAAGGSIISSKIYSNTLYGINNNFSPTNVILASNNWWGASDGPKADNPACWVGNGDRVSDGVIFKPVITSTNGSANFPLSAAPIITLKPSRWFAPADGTTQIYFNITVVDGNGGPLVGRKVRLKSNTATVFDGGFTDINGQTLAYVTSKMVGDASIQAVLDPLTCEDSQSPESVVTFTKPINVTDLFPNSQAPYFSQDLAVTPLPVIVGVTSTIHAVLTNPLTSTVNVDVSFGFVQSSIGLVFGPIKEVKGVNIPPNGSVNLDASWMPKVSGHYCVEVNYSINSVGTSTYNIPNAPNGGGSSQRRNLQPYQPKTDPQSSKDSLDKADKAFKLVSKAPAGPTQIQKGMISAWWGAVKKAASDISQSLGFDPPRQDFAQVTLPIWHFFPRTDPTNYISADRANALNALNDSLSEIEAYGTAASVAMDRYGGAVDAQDLTWAAQQANEMQYYKEKLGSALLTYADRLDNFVILLKAAGETQTVIGVTDVISYQQRLATTGFTQQEIADAKLAGLTDLQIADFKSEIIAANPADVAGDILVKYSDEAAASRELGNALLHPQTFNPGLTVSGGDQMKSLQTSSNSMVQVFDTEETVTVGNPYTQTQIIDLRIRPIDLPASWTATLSPAQVTLDGGKQTIINVIFSAGAPVPQGSVIQVAVEGYIAGNLLGGVTVEIVTPAYRQFNGKMPLYLPMITR